MHFTMATRARNTIFIISPRGKNDAFDIIILLLFFPSISDESQFTIMIIIILVLSRAIFNNRLLD